MGHLTGRTTHHWNQTYTMTDQYVNDRNTGQGWSYDADGRLLTTSLGVFYNYDAAGRVAIVNFNTSTFIGFDGDGGQLKTAEVTQTDTTPTVETKYYIRSSVLGGQVISEVAEDGSKIRTFIYAGGSVLAWQRDTGGVSDTVVWEYRDPSSASVKAEVLQELDPFGADVGLSAPPSNNPSFTESEDSLSNYPDAGSPAEPRGGCTAEGLIVPCDFAARYYETMAGYQRGRVNVTIGDAWRGTIPGGINWQDRSRGGHYVYLNESKLKGVDSSSWHNFVWISGNRESAHSESSTNAHSTSEQQSETCSSLVDIADENTDEGALTRLIYQESSDRNNYDDRDALDELSAILSTVMNRVRFLGTPGLTQGGTEGFGNPGASVADVVYSRGKNPNGRSNIDIQYDGFTPKGIAEWVQNKFNIALNSPIDSTECKKLRAAIRFAQLRNYGFMDPFNGKTMGMRTRGRRTPGSRFYLLGSFGDNSFFGIK
jgi:hypothetical protein